MHVRLIRLDTKEMIIVDKPVYRIGREKGYVDYCIDVSTISRSHCDIITRDRKYFLMDLGTTNGTYINRRRLPVNIEVSLLSGDEVRLANLDFYFEEVL